MKFGPLATAEAEGAILAHSLQAGALRLRKGTRLTPEAIAALAAEGVESVVVARPDPEDLDENAAAARLATALGDHGFDVTAPFTGRVNLTAPAAGLVTLDAAALTAANSIDEAITIATLPDAARLSQGALVATIKIIPYAVRAARLAQVEAALGSGAAPLRFHPFRPRDAALILTETPGMKPGLFAKAEAVTAARLGDLGARLRRVARVAHTEDAVAAALAEADEALVLLLGASATSDRRDVIPAALERAGGEVEQFGMPVDPGNLLLLGRRGAQRIVGLPGCARSPALNGADWVLERLAADLPVGSAQIAAMGVGGLLKEIPQRSQPRAAPRPAPRPAAQRIEVLLLAAGASRRMGGEDKLLRPVDGEPLLRRAAKAAAGSKASAVRVILPPAAEARRAALSGLDVALTDAPQAARGMAASLHAGLLATAPDTAAIIIALADMPEITAEHFNRVIAAFDPREAREICRATSADGVPGHPVLFGARFFESLKGLRADEGARRVLEDNREFVTLVPAPGQGAVVDLDTPAAWAAWEAAQPNQPG